MSVVRRLRSERGSVLTLFAVGLPVFVLFLAFVIDVGNWFEHKRHLQMQADAGALAGGDAFNSCLAGSSGDTTVEQAALQYAGDSSTGGSYNAQIGDTNPANVSVLINSETYADGVVDSDGSSVAWGPPCSTGMVDVKATEFKLPLFFGVGLSTPWLPAINAHARVVIRQAQSEKGLLPVAVPDVNPRYVFATFIDEATGQPPAGCANGCTAQLAKGSYDTARQLQMWSSVTAPLSVPITSRRLGVRLRLVGAFDSSTPCGQVLVECYDMGSATGVVFIHGWSASDSPPDVRNAWMLPGTCSPDGYFAAAACGAGVQAEVDLGNRPLTGTDVTTQVTATVNGGSTSYPLSLQSSPPSSGLATWTLTSGLPISTTGPDTVDLTWSWKKTSGTWNGATCTTKGSNPCQGNGDLGVVQRGFLADPSRSGPVQLVQVGESGTSTAGADSFETGSTHDLTVTIGITGSLAVQSAASDPVVKLRVVGGSQNQSIDCDPSLPNLRDELVQGCAPEYTKNTGTPCASYSTLWNTPQPWNCVKTQTGGSIGQAVQGISDRILGVNVTSCTAPINWPAWKPGDPRIVPLLITPFGTFSGSGNAVVPVIDFATFYVTGWGGNGTGNGDPCPGATPGLPAGYIAGHFIKYIQTLNTGGATQPCDLSAIGTCVAVLTR